MCRMTKAGQRLFVGTERLQSGFGNLFQGFAFLCSLFKHGNEKMARSFRSPKNDRATAEQASGNGALHRLGGCRQCHACGLHRWHQAMLCQRNHGGIGHAHQVGAGRFARQQKKEIRSEGLLTNDITAKIFATHNNPVELCDGHV